MEKDVTVSTEAVRSDPSEGGALSVDGVFEVLAHRRRRYVLYCLREYETPTTLADLADEIAVRENGTDITDVSGEEVKRVYTSLYHTHVPKLEGAGIVQYSQERDMVALSENADRLEPFLEPLTE